MTARSERRKEAREKANIKPEPAKYRNPYEIVFHSKQLYDQFYKSITDLSDKYKNKK